MTELSEHRIRLQEHGVVIPDPTSVFVDPEVPVGAIGPGTILHPFTRIEGAQTSIGPHSVIGAEGPATLKNCITGHGVSFASGFAEAAVLLDGAKVGSAAHLRAGTLLEEYASVAHAVGLKQTILFPWVTLGSLINFCDALMAGGTGPKDHSEVGSSYIHFNFTPQGDKATASLLGDVPRGVLLDQRPIFLGGQGGLVGPSRVAFGTVVAAGNVLRKDVKQDNQLVVPPPLPAIEKGYNLQQYNNVHRKIVHNRYFIAQLFALKEWYLQARSPFMASDPWRASCHKAVLQLLDLASQERIKRLNVVLEKTGQKPYASPAATKPVLPEVPLVAASWPACVQALPESSKRSIRMKLQQYVDELA